MSDAMIERAAMSSKVEIRKLYSTVEVVLADGTEYYFTDDEARNLIEEAEQMAEIYDVDEADYLAFIAQSW